jgi:hypothetical protein
MKLYIVTAGDDYDSDDCYDSHIWGRLSWLTYVVFSCPSFLPTGKTKTILTPWSRGLREKLIFTKQPKIPPPPPTHVYGTKSSSPSSRQPASGPYHEPVESNINSYTLFKTLFNIILPSASTFSECDIVHIISPYIIFCCNVCYLYICTFV